ncbi:Rv1733c family protein [Streptomyces roseoviridis]|uniref:Transmembrane protein n=1 Tax=Streptomyces roseoviridis TaxID=67361 RepID=A0ABV5QUG6_9ACTN
MLLWRWRRNELRHRSHAVEGWVLVVLMVAGFIGAPLGGAVAGDAVLEARARQRSESHLTVAVLAESATPPAGGSTRTTAEARWTDAGGATHRGRVPVASHLERGARVPVWTDEDGAMTSAPPGQAAARYDAAVAALAVTVSLGLLVLTLHRLVRRHYERRRAALWGRGWARVAPEWARKDA